MTAFLGACLIRLWGRTWRIRFIDEDVLEQARKVSPAVIYTFWHGRLLALAYSYRSQSVHVLASEHRDGELMGQTIRFLGFGHVRGSSSRGGARAIRQLVDKLRQGFDLGISVDGPKGPKHVFKSGSLEIAKLTGCALIPITASSKRHWALSSWDSFQLPKPFTKVFVRVGEPVFVSSDATPEVLEEKRLQVERVLRAITESNDAAVSTG
ncbi:MAG: lysophospholipid acyltransferase family protein [Candidatus Krumholzibacteria bacterium]|nr:lysophospholipid acyltransferase family protein [Candidatus Krumholzibacteria bacterium]